MGEFVRLEVADGVGTIRLDRPKMNALNVQMQDEIRAAATEATERDDVTRGRRLGRRAGLRRRRRHQGDGRHVVRRHGRGAPVVCSRRFTAVARIPKPVVAAITGYALGGGCELALCADVRFAADDAVARSARGPARRHPRRRRHPAADPADRPEQGQGPHLHRPLRQGRRGAGHRAGRPGRRRPSQVYAEAVAWAGQFAAAAAYALRAAKETIDRGLEADLETGLEIERQQFAALFATEDRDIGMQSFIENGPGKARFVGR